jgi:hypothetical protein
LATAETQWEQVPLVEGNSPHEPAKLTQLIFIEMPIMIKRGPIIGKISE